MARPILALVPDQDIGPLAGYKFVAASSSTLSSASPKDLEARYLRSQYRAMHHALLAGAHAVDEALDPELIVDALAVAKMDTLPVIAAAIEETVKAEALRTVPVYFPEMLHDLDVEAYKKVFNESVEKEVVASGQKILNMIEAAQNIKPKPSSPQGLYHFWFTGDVPEDSYGAFRADTLEGGQAAIKHQYSADYDMAFDSKDDGMIVTFTKKASKKTRGQGEFGMIPRPYIDWNETPVGLEIKVSPEAQKELKAEADAGKHGLDDIFIQNVLSAMIDAGWELIPPEAIGALTSSLIISEHATVEDDGTYSVHGPVYWWPNYQIQGPLTDLIETGKTVAKKEVGEPSEDVSKVTAARK